MSGRRLLPGFVAATGGPPRPPVEHAADAVCGPAHLTHWGVRPIPGAEPALALSRVVRDHDGAVPDARLADALRADPASLTALLPPFAAVHGDPRGVTMVADHMGFRQLFHTDAAAPAAPGMSTSALALGWRDGAAALDEAAVAVQSLLGWQLGTRTLFDGVRKLPAGAVARLDGGVSVTQPAAPPTEPIALDEAVRTAAEILRASLRALLDDHPDAVLQLTGGLDSRLLLSAIPVARRRGLEAMTLGVRGSGDVEIAGDIAERYGIRHEVHRVPEIAVDPAEAWELATAAAVELDGMADPVALAALTLAEREFEQGVRISGLGGEVARGFYYVGAVRDRTYTRRDAERLAAWRMFVNEAVDPGLLTDEFSAWARETAYDAVHDALREGGDEWFRATDHLYLRHRMQRWAGATDTAVGYRRVVVNPMLDEAFLDVAARLAPEDKAHSRFLARLQLELDPELGRRPLEGRPSPAVYANPGPWQPAVDAVATGRRFARKALQRVRRAARPPAGGDVLAAAVVEHWRADPSAIATVAALPFVRTAWIDDVLARRAQPQPSSVSFLTNLVVALSAPRP